MNDALRDVFPGCPEIDHGYAYLNDKPGLGIIDEAKAAKYPCEGEYLPGRWRVPLTVRLQDRK